MVLPAGGVYRGRGAGGVPEDSADEDRRAERAAAQGVQEAQAHLSSVSLCSSLWAYV